jgi:GNAT superfamily N-acetyltransferase
MEHKIRYANINDIDKIIYFITELAIYEKMLDEVVVTKDLIKKWLFDDKIAEVIFVTENDIEVGFALFFHNYSTFVGRAGIYLEDLYVLPEYRHKGYGKALIKKLANICIERQCGRFEWCCLNWNKPSIDFYLSLGAKPMSDWTTYRLDGKALLNLTKEK